MGVQPKSIRLKIAFFKLSNKTDFLNVRKYLPSNKDIYMYSKKQKFSPDSPKMYATITQRERERKSILQKKHNKICIKLNSRYILQAISQVIIDYQVLEA